jgi:lysophospholipid acyltransferase (LPLAT)-like uncharacterized protein
MEILMFKDDPDWKTDRSFRSRLANYPKRLLSRMGTLTLDAVHRSADLKIAYYDPSVDPARPEYNEHCIFVFWHENLAILLPQWPRCPVTMLVSRHRDAHWLNYSAELWGFNVVRGSTTRGGADALRQLRKISHLSSIAITPDGPRGPRRQMAAGALFLASRLQMPLVPVGVGYDRPFRLNTWDQFALPRPFSRARVVFGPKLRLARDLSRDGLELARKDAAVLLGELDEFANRWAATEKRVLQELPFVRARRTNELEFPVKSTAESATQPVARNLFDVLRVESPQAA